MCNLVELTLYAGEKRAEYKEAVLVRPHSELPEEAELKCSASKSPSELRVSGDYYIYPIKLNPPTFKTWRYSKTYFSPFLSHRS